MRRFFIVCLLALSLASCVRSRPVIKYAKLTDLPKITVSDLASLSEEARRKLVERDEKLKSYILTLEAKIDKYNESARKSHR